MTEVKQVILWEPKRAPKRNASGVEIPNEFVGKFRTKVREGVVGSFRCKGKNDAGVEWDFWAKDVDSIYGVLRWIDVRTTDFGAKIILFLETEKALHQLTLKCDTSTLHNVMNHLCGLGKDVATAVLNLSFWVREKKDANGKVKLSKKNEPLWAQTLMFRDTPEQFTFETWKEFARENGLEWVQTTKGVEKVWDSQAHFDYWLGRLADLQRFLLKTENVLPFCWNSVTACENGLLTKEEIEKTNEIYERIKTKYRFPFSRQEVTADDVDLETVGTGDFPTEEVGRNYENAEAELLPTDKDDLPF